MNCTFFIKCGIIEQSVGFMFLKYFKGKGDFELKRTLQYHRTHRNITDAFIKLIIEKPFEKITVQDIITEAMINRSTFYQHFSDKYAMLKDLQEKHMNELIFEHENILKHKHTDLVHIDQVMGSYMKKNRQVLKSLLKIKTEHVDIVKQWKNYFFQYFQENSNSPLIDIEADMLSGLFVNFFIYFLEHDDLQENYSTIMFESFFKVILVFFQIDKDSNASDELLNLIKKYSKH